MDIVMASCNSDACLSVVAEQLMATLRWEFEQNCVLDGGQFMYFVESLRKIQADYTERHGLDLNLMPHHLLKPMGLDDAAPAAEWDGFSMADREQYEARMNEVRQAWENGTPLAEDRFPELAGLVSPERADKENAVHRIIIALLCVRPYDIYYKLNVHGSVTTQAVRDFLRPIERLAKRFDQQAKSFDPDADRPLRDVRDVVFMVFFDEVSPLQFMGGSFCNAVLFARVS